MISKRMQKRLSGVRKETRPELSEALNMCLLGSDRARDKRTREIWNERHPDDPVTKGWLIHHRDGNKVNVSESNLQKLTIRDHWFLHRVQRKNWKTYIEFLDIDDYGDPYLRVRDYWERQGLT